MDEISRIGQRLVESIQELEVAKIRTELWDHLPVFYCETHGMEWSYANEALTEFLGFDLTTITIHEWYHCIVHSDYVQKAIEYYANGTGGPEMRRPLHSKVWGADGRYHDVLWWAVVDSESRRGAAVGILVEPALAALEGGDGG